MLFGAIVSNLPEIILGLVYTYTVFKVGRWWEARKRT